MSISISVSVFFLHNVASKSSCRASTGLVVDKAGSQEPQELKLVTLILPIFFCSCCWMPLRGLQCLLACSYCGSLHGIDQCRADFIPILSSLSTDVVLLTGCSKYCQASAGGKSNRVAKEWLSCLMQKARKPLSARARPVNLVGAGQSTEEYIGLYRNRSGCRRVR